MNLYSAIRFRSTGLTIVNSEPRLIADTGNITSVGDFKWSEHQTEISNLKENESAVFHTVTAPNPIEGWRITRLPDYRANRPVWDEQAKEHVVISNGKCVLRHFDGQEAFRADHQDGMADCSYAPSEAIALRVLIENGKATCAWTYRAVNPCYLRACCEEPIKAMFDAILSRKRSARFIGRI